MRPAYYDAPVSRFLTDNPEQVLGALVKAHHFAGDILQRNAWQFQIKQLQGALSELGDTQAHIFFEFTIPRMGKRVDVLLVVEDTIVVVEYKVGAKRFDAAAIDQTMDYALDLSNFHRGSHDKRILPVLVATGAYPETAELILTPSGAHSVVCTNGPGLIGLLHRLMSRVAAPPIDAETWLREPYLPTPTIIEAAQALFGGHSVQEISRSESDTPGLERTAAAVGRSIEQAKQGGHKTICFITGVPGSGKTLAGLNIAIERQNVDKGEHAVFLSGNGPLVAVLREALARDDVARAKARGEKLKKTDAKRSANAFIQNIHHFRDEALRSSEAPAERVVIFDEAQRAWDLEQTSRFMKQRKGHDSFDQSEPEFLIEAMDRHDGYAVIVCLVGGGQEINTGEAGLPGWFRALRDRHTSWRVVVSDQLADPHYGRGDDIRQWIEPSRLEVDAGLHLAVSMRSFRAERVSDFVAALLDRKPERARALLAELGERYPIVMTRSLERARAWLREQARGSERFGIVASSGALRLKPLGLNPKLKIDPVHWFLNGKQDVRSSYYLEDVASEFDVQGLEIDFACVAWGANFVPEGTDWRYRRFSGTRWQAVKKADDQLYLKNAYRVLLTRARQGMVIFVPLGSDRDSTRAKHWYEAIARYLMLCGIREID